MVLLLPQTLQMFHNATSRISWGLFLQHDNVSPPSGLLDDQLLVKVVKDKLMSNPCKNQGFVLDGFPKSYEQARELFSGETLKQGQTIAHWCHHNTKTLFVLFVQTNKSQMTQHPWLLQRARGFYQVVDAENWKQNLKFQTFLSFTRKSSDVEWRLLWFCSECVVYLDATDELLRDRVMNLPEKVVQEHNYEQDHFLGRLSKYRENNAENDTVLQYFDEIDISPLRIGNPFVFMYTYKTCSWEVFEITRSLVNWKSSCPNSTFSTRFKYSIYIIT